MVEFLFVLYLVSGYIKGVMKGYGVALPIDLTLLSGILLLAGTCYHAFIWRGEIFRQLKKDYWMVLPLLGFYAWILVSTFWISPAEEFGPRKAFLFLTNLLSFSVPLFYRGVNVQRFSSFFLGFAFIYGVFMFIMYASRGIDHPEYMGFADDEIFSGMYLKAGMIMGLAFLLVLGLRKMRDRLITGSLFFFLLLATAARGPILFCLFSLLVLHLVSRFLKRRFGVRLAEFSVQKGMRWSRMLFLLLLINLPVIALIGTNEFVRSPYWRTYIRFSKFIPMPDLDFLAPSGSVAEEKDIVEREKEKEKRLHESRVAHIKFSTGKIFEDWDTFFFGYGFGSYQMIKAGEQGRGYPHNIVLEIMFELGLIGLLLALQFFFIVLWQIYRNGHAVLGVCFIFIFLNTLKSYSLVDIREMFGFISMILFLSPPKNGSGFLQE